MRISLNWLKKLVKIDVSDAELIRLIGARLVEVEGVIDETHKYDNIYVVKVVSAEKIAETHLTKCLIDDGGKCESAKLQRMENGLIQVMCGAPNVREGMLAVWLAPGAVVPASVHEDAPFVIGKRRMLGEYDSYGMLAGADELDFGDDHSGIVEIAGNGLEYCRGEVIQPGESLAELFDLKDLILEIENKSLTHRPDCFGMIGFAREVAGILGQKFEEKQVDIGGGLEIRNSGGVKIEVCNPEVCERYTAVVFEKHGELTHRYLNQQDILLAKSGMRPVSPVVDATNYLLLLTGQPLHAFDYDKFVAVGGKEYADVRVRLARDGERLVLLDGKEIILNKNDIVICSGETPVALAGAMGGASTEIDAETRNILLESATFSLYNLRKTQMAHGIFSEAITRFTKGQPAYQTLKVAEDFARMVRGGYAVREVVDAYKKVEADIVVKITTFEVNRLLGTEYSDELIKRTLENVGFEVDLKDGKMAVKAPAWRTDIHIKEDIIEEVGRLLGYDNILPVLPLHGTTNKNAMLELKERIEDKMATFGANEVLTYSFVSGRLLDRAGQKVESSYRIVNSISPELQYVRQSLIPSLLDKAHMNQKMPVDKFAIYEINKVYKKDWGVDAENVPVEKNRIALVLAERKNNDTAFYKAKKYAAELLKGLGVEVEFLPVKNDTDDMGAFEAKRTARIVLRDGELLGLVGEFKNSVRNEFKLEKFLAGFELDLDLILQNLGRSRKIFIGKKEVRDLTVATKGDYAEVEQKIRGILDKKKVGAEIQPRGVYQENADSDKKITVRLVFETFDSEVMRLIEKEFEG